MDDIGLGGYLAHFGYECGVVLFLVVFLIAKYATKINLLSSLILALFAGALGYFASPYLFFLLFSLMGYSF
jgi:hypothetical protein